MQEPRQLRQRLDERRRFREKSPPQRAKADLVLHPALEKRLRGHPQVEIRIELAPEAFDVQQRLLEQYELWLDLDVEAARRTEELHEDFAERNFLQRPVEDRLAHDADFAFELVDARVRGHPSRLEVRCRNAAVVAPEERQEVLREIALVALRQRAHDAEVERDVPGVIGRVDADEDIARVHIRVKKAVAEHLREEDFDAGAREALEIDAGGDEIGDAPDRYARHPLHDENLAR